MAYTIFQKIDKWFNPYKYSNEGMLALEMQQNPRKRNKGRTAQEIVDNKELLGVNFLPQKQSFNITEAIQKLQELPFDNALYYHDLDVHILATKYDTNSSKRYQARSQKQRRKLKKNLLIYPRDVDIFDMTHIQAVGFHGIEDREEMLVGWNSRQNQQDMRIFEEGISFINSTQPIIWYTIIEFQNKTDYSAIWNTKITSLDGEILTEKSFHDTSNFVWK